MSAMIMPYPDDNIIFNTYSFLQISPFFCFLFNNVSWVLGKVDTDDLFKDEHQTVTILSTVAFLKWVSVLSAALSKKKLF